jgi:hypothetical protein
MIETLMIRVVVNMDIGDMEESFKCKKIAKKSVITSPEGTWDDEDDNFTTYTHGKLVVPKCKITKMDYKVKFFYVWYLKACALDIEFLRAKVLKELFDCDPFDLHVLFEDIHTLYHFQRLDTTLITI